jgi:hypothetical protein
MPYTCFSYSAGLPLGAGNRDATQRAPHDSKLCFRYYPGDLPHDSKICFSYYPGDLPHDSKICFSYYPGDMPPGVRNRNARQQAPHDSKICFGYY